MKQQGGFVELTGIEYTKDMHKQDCERLGYLITRAPQSWCFVEELK